VVNTDQLMVKGNVAEAYISGIHPGDSLLVYFPDLQKEIHSTAFYVSKGIDVVNRTFTVEVKLPQNPDYHPNMIAMLKIMDYSSPSSISVPVNLVQSDPTGTYLFVAKNENGIEVARKQPIKTGKVYNGMFQITEGLKKGDKIITIGYDDLNNGDAISY